MRGQKPNWHDGKIEVIYLGNVAAQDATPPSCAPPPLSQTR